jgi:hypothetical protein
MKNQNTVTMKNQNTVTMTKQELPKWFDGTVYDEGLIVQNPYSQEEYELNNIELSMYDFIIDVNFLYEKGDVEDNVVTNMRKGLTWFRKNNPEAYMALLD